MVEEKRTVELNLTEGEASIATMLLQCGIKEVRKILEEHGSENTLGYQDVSGIANRICNKLNKTFDGNLYEITKKELLEELAKSAFFVKPMKFDGEIAYLDLEKK